MASTRTVYAGLKEEKAEIIKRTTYSTKNPDIGREEETVSVGIDTVYDLMKAEDRRAIMVMMIKALERDDRNNPRALASIYDIIIEDTKAVMEEIEDELPFL